MGRCWCFCRNSQPSRTQGSAGKRLPHRRFRRDVSSTPWGQPWASFLTMAWSNRASTPQRALFEGRFLLMLCMLLSLSNHATASTTKEWSVDWVWKGAAISHWKCETELSKKQLGGGGSCQTVSSICHFTSVVFFSKTHNPSEIINTRPAPIEGHSIKYLTVFLKTIEVIENRKVWETTTNKRSLRRYYNKVLCAVLDRILDQKAYIWYKLRKFEWSLGFS